jgi:hypothetical protein
MFQYSGLQMKKPPSLAVFLESGLGSLSCRFYVNLPLLHRHGAGIAKVKIKEKAAKKHAGAVPCSECGQ